MRKVEIGIFAVGLASFVVAAFFIGQGTGDTLWRVGVAAMLLDFVVIHLWPSPRA